MAQYMTGPNTFQVVEDEGTQKVSKASPNAPGPRSFAATVAQKLAHRRAKEAQEPDKRDKRDALREPQPAASKPVVKFTGSSQLVPQHRPESKKSINVVVQQEGPKPPIGTYADVSPVDKLKRETANTYKYTPEARQYLYDTKTGLDLTADAFDDYGGWWDDREHVIQVNNPLAQHPEQSEQILAHEYGHRLYDDRTLGPRWRGKGMQTVDPFVIQQMRTSYNSMFPDTVPDWEVYAQLAARPFQMTPAEREEYFPGVFQPMPPPPQPDIESPYPNIDRRPSWYTTWGRPIRSAYDRYLHSQRLLGAPDDQILHEDEFYEYIDEHGTEPPQG